MSCLYAHIYVHACHSVLMYFLSMLYLNHNKHFIIISSCACLLTLYCLDFQLLAIPANFTAEQRAAEEERQIAAIEKLALFLPDIFKNNTRKKRFRKICVDEMPWRAQVGTFEIYILMPAFETFITSCQLNCFNNLLTIKNSTISFYQSVILDNFFTYVN